MCPLPFAPFGNGNDNKLLLYQRLELTKWKCCRPQLNPVSFPVTSSQQHLTCATSGPTLSLSLTLKVGCNFGQHAARAALSPTGRYQPSRRHAESSMLPLSLLLSSSRSFAACCPVARAQTSSSSTLTSRTRAGPSSTPTQRQRRSFCMQSMACSVFDHVVVGHADCLSRCKPCLSGCFVLLAPAK